MNRRQYLTEAINVPDATFIGNGKGYDLFDITTWEAAQQFVVENTTREAGARYTQNQATFNANINQNQHLYFFVEEDSNKVFGGVVKSQNTTGIVKVKNNEGTAVSISANFLFECLAGDNNNNVDVCRYNLPLYLIPGAVFNNIENHIFLIENNTVKAVIGQLFSSDELEDLVLPEHVTRIADNAFTYGLKINSILLDTKIIDLTSAALNGVDTIYVPFIDASEAPTTWAADWATGKNVIYGYGLTEEEIAELNQQKAEELRLERERREREEARRAEEARREANKIRYKVEGKEITILGTRPGILRVEIPETIEGKPVTKIKAYAFAYSTINYIVLPGTLKIIEKYAFAYSSLHQYSIAIPEKCIVGKDAFIGTNCTIERI